MAGRGAGRGDDPPLAELDPDAADVDSWEDDEEPYDDYDDPEAQYDEDDEDDEDDEVATVSAVDEDDGYDDEEPYDAEDEHDDDEHDDEHDDDGYDEPAGAPAVATVDRRVLVPVADRADDGWYDYDEELEGDDGYADDDEYDDPWPPPAPDRVPVPVGASADASDPSIWAPATAPGAWVALGRPRFDNPLHGLLTEPLQARTRRRNLSVFSLAGITNVLLLAYGVTAVLLAGFTAALARRRSALEIVDVKSRAATTLRAEQLVDATSLGVAALLGATAIASMVWCAVAAHNQRMLAEDDRPPSPAAAALGWLVPLANVVLPYRTVAMLSAGPFGHHDVLRSVRVWWSCWLASLGAAAYTIVASRAPESARDASWLTLVALLVTALFLLCFSQAITVFRGIARLQHELAVERD